MTPRGNSLVQRTQREAVENRKGMMTPMATTDVVDHINERLTNPARREVTCELFGDRIDGFVCMLRKKALAACGEISCNGCALFPA
jgi:hypothetical protein